jgi:hypothetical protein
MNMLNSTTQLPKDRDDLRQRKLALAKALPR